MINTAFQSWKNLRLLTCSIYSRDSREKKKKYVKTFKTFSCHDKQVSVFLKFYSWQDYRHAIDVFHSHLQRREKGDIFVLLVLP